jgi:hypothetical protein
MLADIFSQALSSRDPEAALALIFVLPTVCLTLLLMFGIWMWFSTRIRQWEMSLKHTMLERGMSPEEITAVLGATSSKSPRSLSFPPMTSCGSKRDHAY